MSRTQTLATLVAAVALLAGAAAASAHVEVRAADGRAAGEIIVTVPNESLAADTISVAVQLPRNVVGVTIPRVPGWTHTEQTIPLDPPLRIGGAEIATRVSTVTWTGDRIPPGQEADFRLRVTVAQGTTRTGLVFPAVQRYSDGEVVRWIGAPNSDKPAGVLASAVPAVPAVAVTTPTTPTATSTQSGTPTTATTSDGDGGNPAGLIFALVGAAIAIGGVVAIIRSRRAKK
jgi:uncharacterized protein YcnI